MSVVDLIRTFGRQQFAAMKLPIRSVGHMDAVAAVKRNVVFVSRRFTAY